MLSLQILPADRVLAAQRMRIRQNDEHAFVPEPGDVAIARNGLAHDEDDVELFRTKQRQIFARRSFDDANVDLRMLGRIASQQLRQESRRQRGKENARL